MARKQRFFEWTKRLGQRHFYLGDATETLCKMPMLGNNYAAVLPEKDKHTCLTCLQERDTIERSGYLT